MSCDMPSRTPADNVSEIVNKTKILVDQLRLAIIHQDNLTKDCFDKTASELSETVESIKRTHNKLNQEYEGVKEEVKTGEERLNNYAEEFQKIVEENEFLKETEEDISSRKVAFDEQGKIGKILKEELHIYKLITGVRFDFSFEEDSLAGYIGISGTKPCNSTLVPFEINKICSSQFLWDQVSKACSEISEY